MKPMTDSELSAFSGQLAMLLHSGISLLEGVSILRDDLPEGEGRTILHTLLEKLEETGELAAALRDVQICPSYFVKMTEVGERSGTLDDVMASLSDYYGRQEKLTRSIRSALTYPLTLLFMLFAVLLVLMTQVMPVFEDVFRQLGIEMTGVPAVVFRISAALQRSSAALLILTAVLAAAAVCALRFRQGRDFLMRLMQKLPIGRKVADCIACSRFCDALGLSLHSGLDVDEGFALASGMTQQPDFLEKTKRAGALVEAGGDLADALRETGILTGLHARMVSVGFRTGSAEEVLRQISVHAQEEADERIQSAVSALEPTLTAVLSVLTGLILVSVMLPLLGAMANIG